MEEWVKIPATVCASLMKTRDILPISLETKVILQTFEVNVCYLTNTYFTNK